jgi:hypothetical protein
MHKTEILLERVSSVVISSKKVSELKGENFNIFNLLGISTNEVKLHSTFIGYLLDPKGSHGLKIKPLIHFIDLLENNFTDIIPKSFNINLAQVSIEKSIGFVSEDSQEGGRIDILISDGEHSITIENKIYAGDQKNQIIRYNNYRKGNNTVLYLTLTRKEPDKKSYGNLEVDKDFYLLSYQEDILKWLAVCRQEAIDLPILRETIHQYEILIKQFTGKLTSDEMNREIIDLIKNNLEAASQIFSNYDKARHELLDSFRNEVLECLKQEIDRDEELRNFYSVSLRKGINEKFASITTERRCKLSIKIEPFNGWGWGDGSLYIGVLRTDLDNWNEAETAFIQKVRKENNFQKNNKWWLDWEYLNINFDKFESLRQISSPDSKSELIKMIVESSISYMKAKKPILAEFETLAFQ